MRDESTDPRFRLVVDGQTMPCQRFTHAGIMIYVTAVPWPSGVSPWLEVNHGHGWQRLHLCVPLASPRKEG